MLALSSQALLISSLLRPSGKRLRPSQAHSLPLFLSLFKMSTPKDANWKPEETRYFFQLYAEERRKGNMVGEEADSDSDEEEGGDDDDDEDDGGGGGGGGSGGGGHIVYEPTGDRAMEDLRDNITNEYGRGRLPY
ncbi:hypothetical protein YC2023_098394 [Brassica napus]